MSSTKFSVGQRVRITRDAASAAVVLADDLGTVEDIDYTYVDDPTFTVRPDVWRGGNLLNEEPLWFFQADDLEPVQETGALTRGAEMVHGAREGSYGDPVENFTRIADLWRSAFGWEVTPAQVAMAMILLKISREQSRSQADNLDDIEGYVECARIIAHRAEADS